MEIINKSLLCEVLGIDERLCRIDKLVDNTLFFYTFHNVGEYQNYINIYELVHNSLKEWAYKQGYIILSGHSAYSIGLFFCSCKGWLSENYDKQIEINHKTEPEAIFQACQWILDNKI